MLDAVVWRNVHLRSLTFKAAGDYIDIDHIEDKVKISLTFDSILNNAPRMSCPITGTKAKTPFFQKLTAASTTPLTLSSSHAVTSGKLDTNSSVANALISAVLKTINPARSW